MVQFKDDPIQKVHYSNRKERRALSAKSSAIKFSDRERREKKIVTNWDIALMSVELLEKKITVESHRIARASAISGELTKVWITDPWDGAARGGPEKTQPSPDVFLSEFQAASVLQVINLKTSSLLDDCPIEARGP